MTPADRLACSTITFRELSLAHALDEIHALGFGAIDLGVMPGFCDHHLSRGNAIHPEKIALLTEKKHLKVRTVNCDPGILADEPEQVVERFRKFLAIARAVNATGISVGSGAPADPKDYPAALAATVEVLRHFSDLASDGGISLLIEAPHHYRLCNTVERALELIEAVDHSNAYLLLDTSHVRAGGDDVVATATRYGERLRHVHLRDAVDGDIHRSLGDGDVDFGRFFGELERLGYAGWSTLELETGAASLEKKREQVRQSLGLIRALATLPTDATPTVMRFPR